MNYCILPIFKIIYKKNTFSDKLVSGIFGTCDNFKFYLINDQLKGWKSFKSEIEMHWYQTIKVGCHI
jgi:hypothetical protein